MPTAESSALDITIGMSICAAIVQHSTHTAQRSDLEHRNVGGAGAHHGQRVVGLADALVGGDRHVDPPPQLGEFWHRRARLLEVLQRAACGSAPAASTASATVQPPLASTRTVGTNARTASTAGDVVGQGLSRLGDLHLRGAGAGEAGQHLGHLRGADGRHGGVDRDPVAHARRRRLVGRLDPGGQPVAASAWPYSRNAPNSPQPAGPSISATSRTVMPRKRTRIGSATTCRRSSRSSSGVKIRLRQRF